MDDTKEARKKGKRESEETLKSLTKLVRILECFSVNDRTLSLAEICQRTGLPKSTAHRCVVSLRDVGFLDQGRERDRYRLGLRLFELGDIVLANLDVHREARPMVDTLQRMTGQTVHLAVFDGLRAVVVQRVDSAGESGPTQGFIENAPAYCTSLGKAILAHQPDEVVDRVIASGLVRYTEQTIVDPEALRRVLEDVRKAGYAVDNGEHQPSLRCVGAPIRDQSGRVFAAVSISGPVWKISTDEIPELARIVIHQATVISQRLGWHDTTEIGSRLAPTV